MMLSTLVLLAALQAPVELGLERYEPIEGRSVVGFDGTSTLHDFTGKTGEVHGELRVDLGNVDATTAGEFWIEAATLDTDSESRDEEMRKHLDTERFPRITFSIDSVAGVVTDRAGSLTGRGRFTIKGISRQRSFPLTVEPEGKDAIHIEGRVTFDIRDHGIAPPTKVVVGMGEMVTVWFDLHMKTIDSPPVAAHRSELLVHERIEVTGQPAVEVEHTEYLWHSALGTLWERSFKGELAVSSAGEVHVRDLHTLGSETSIRSAEQAFLESRERLASFRAKLEAMSAKKRARAGKKIEHSIERLNLAFANAPAEGPVEVLREGDTVRFMLGDTEWARAEGSVGEDSVALLALATADLPEAVQAALTQLEGTPKKLTLRTASQAGVRTTTYEFSQAVKGTTPTWAWQSNAWTAPTAPMEKK